MRHNPAVCQIDALLFSNQNQNNKERKKSGSAFGNELLSGVMNGGVELFGIDPLRNTDSFFYFSL